MRKIKTFIFVLLFSLIGIGGFAFEKGFTLGIKANFSGSYTDPHINKKDMDYLGAKFMKGMLGFIMSGEVELSYIFDSETYFKKQNSYVFGGLGLGFNLGIGQGFSGQISGQDNESIGQINVYCRIYMTPVLNFGTSLKTYLLGNRLVLGFTIGGKMPLDPQPTYELYSNLSDEDLEKLKTGANIDFYPETGTLIVSPEMMKKINPVGVLFKGSIEYNQPVISTTQVTIGAYIQYTIYRPRYVTMPKKVEHAAIGNGKLKDVDINFQRDPIKSFFMNSLDFGVNIGLLFKV